jgi:hypothetical protein
MRILVTGLAAFLSAPLLQAGLINGGFETGDLSGWTTFTTDNGSLGAGGDVVPFDTSGRGVSPSAHFQVGEAVFNPFDPAGGGGIFQEVSLGTGTLNIAADIAAMTHAVGNLEGGLFELLFDGLVVDAHDMGAIGANSVERARLFASLTVTAGPHEIRFLMTRPFGVNAITPHQYIDDVTLSGEAAIPEPATLALVGIGLLELARRRAR